MTRIAATALALLATPLAAQDFSQGSEARSWNLYAEVPARFEARVVDVLCELTGECAADCGAGGHQMGLVRTADGVLVMPLKNNQPVFSGAAADLAPYCNQTVEVDGLMIEDEDLNVRYVYQVQRIKPQDGEWTKANRFTQVWAQSHPDAAGDGPWFRRDPRVNEVIDREGYLGLGPEEDAAFIEEND
ncbi:hypothetical protein [Sulfitobacter sabulilitoris]|uniref:DUF2147 domain-containing protein n=1 Tax=Sulfitobacter sabulilitoris TaxID=2562655 RepID=A0A5S3PLZ3_9RHOB|nr:hypothetical protein [Sulfitobacter sabulilitoris]TMM55403.1 hypothetical protein FDT80_07590 [Sulfitobacter sabulilitoris]